MDSDDPLGVVRPSAPSRAARSLAQTQSVFGARLCKKAVANVKNKARDPASGDGDGAHMTSAVVDVPSSEFGAVFFWPIHFITEPMSHHESSLSHLNLVGFRGSRVRISGNGRFMIHVATEAKLQVSAAFIPGRICESHVAMVAKKVLKTVSDVTAMTGVVSKPVAFLTAQLGEPWM